MSFRERYLEFLRKKCPQFDNVHLAVDCSGGMASLLAREVFPNAVFINDEVDGTFSCHSPNPLLASAREQLSVLVRERKLDCGIIFDGDADRAMVVDERGEFVQPDFLIPIVARTMKTAATDEVVLHDVRTSRGAIETLREDGFKPVMVPVGHAFAKPKMRELKALCGGELAGHYYFGDFFGCDSGLIASMRILGEFAKAKARGLSFSQMMAPISGRYANSGELNFKVEDKEVAIARVLEAVKHLAPEISRSTIDGIRVEFADGWFNVRKSNTEPYLRLIIEARTIAMLSDWKRVLTAAI